ncbi:putative sodium-dependent multivitamin transporter [Dermacentor albipictus]|uniref:putative sodium-dependent multivitamin transporter n=1 Tax=Dermacentor albipictus TaxID=60249 RepID=UPI0038FC9AEC
MPAMMPAAEYAVFSVLMALNLGLGLYFSLPRKKASSAGTKAEVFLGSRALRVFPLAASVVASLISSTGMVGLTGHFYAYGFHFMWTSLTTVLVAPVAGWLFLTVLYELRVTSIFEQSIGALAIFAASLTIVTVFGVSLLWSNIIIGLCATCYTALGGLRGVVWTDCMQLVFILLGPATVIAKVIIDSRSSATAIQPVDDFNLRPYIANIEFNLSHDENVWVTVAALTASLYRVGMDQVVVQRCMASRSLASAKRTVILGAVLLIVVNLVKLAMAVALILWFRGCDPALLGAIGSHDQILPFYIKTSLMSFPGFTGLFLAAVVSAATRQPLSTSTSYRHTSGSSILTSAG